MKSGDNVLSFPLVQVWSAYLKMGEFHNTWNVRNPHFCRV